MLRQAVAEDGERPAGVIGGGDDQDPLGVRHKHGATNTTSSAVELISPGQTSTFPAQRITGVNSAFDSVNCRR